MFRAVKLHKGIQAGVKTSPAYLIVDGVAQRLPSRNVPGKPALFCGSDRAIDGDPRHELGVNEVPARAAHFPNTFIGLLPSGLEEFQQRLAHIFAFVLRRFESCLAALKESVGNLAKNIQLKL